LQDESRGPFANQPTERSRSVSIETSNDAQWLTAGIAKARKLHASVTDAVSNQIANLMVGQLRERQLSSTELARIAGVLLLDMGAASPQTEARE
jgi:hypothetical protein